MHFIWGISEEWGRGLSAGALGSPVQRYETRVPLDKDNSRVPEWGCRSPSSSASRGASRRRRCPLPPRRRRPPRRSPSRHRASWTRASRRSACSPRECRSLLPTRRHGLQEPPPGYVLCSLTFFSLGYGWQGMWVCVVFSGLGYGWDAQG